MIRYGCLSPFLRISGRSHLYHFSSPACSSSATSIEKDAGDEAESCVVPAAPPWEEVALTNRYIYQCDLDPLSLRADLNRYPSISLEDVHRAEELYGNHARRLVIKDNKLYGRDCAPKAIVGVSKFVEDMLLLILQRVKVPDVDFVLNCSDYPAVWKEGFRSSRADAPVVSMCGSTKHNDMYVHSIITSDSPRWIFIYACCSCTHARGFVSLLAHLLNSISGVSDVVVVGCCTKQNCTNIYTRPVGCRSNQGQRSGKVALGRAQEPNGLAGFRFESSTVQVQFAGQLTAICRYGLA